MQISVVVPTCRRPDLLARCLDALRAQTIEPEAWEVIIADDAASEATRAQVEAAAANFAPVPVRYQPVTATQGPAAARNAGWRLATGTVIAFTDDDCIPDPGWLAAGLAHLEATGADAAGGRIVVPLPPDPTDYEADAAGLSRAEFATANAFVRRAALMAVGGFDERYTAAWREDSDLQFALLTAGFRLEAVPDAAVVHPVRPARWGISLSQQRKARFEALLYRNFPRLYRQRIAAGPPWGYYLTVLALGIALIGWIWSGWLAFGSGLIWLALTTEFCRRRLRNTSHRPGHIIEMAVTSALIPPLSIYWRLWGAIRYRVWFF